ncbi:MAG TPA: DoxX family protein [Verrucomicrobiales bacterium]|jgi:putative oxidoreductase|nr:DoxX family protein [Verrucomicrobiales bacterium]
MKGFFSFLNLNFLPASQDFGLLLLRAASGLGMLFVHGWGKAEMFFGFGAWTAVKNADRLKTIAAFSDPLHIGGRLTLGLLVFAEVICAAMLVIGFCTRFAALALSVAMGVAFFVQKKMILFGKDSGEMAALYFAAFLVILFSGPGKFSFDGSSGGNA